MAKLGSFSSEQDSVQEDQEGVDPNLVHPGAVHSGAVHSGAVHSGAVHPRSGDEDAEDDALREPAEYTDLLNTDWIERAHEGASIEDEQSFDFDVELSGARDTDADEESVNLFEIDVGSLLTSSPVGATDLEAGPLDPFVTEGLIDLRSSSEGELPDVAADELGSQAGPHGLSLPRGEATSASDASDEVAGDDERFPAFEEAPPAVPPGWADDAGQEGIAEEGD